MIMAFIEEAILSGLISKVINDGIDVSIPAIKAAISNGFVKKKDVSLQVYDIIISSFNAITHNKYIKNQEAVYKSTEYLLKNFKSYDNNRNMEIFKECCTKLNCSYSDDLYLKFVKQVHIELSKEKNIELYRHIILKILNEKNLYDQEMIKILVDKLNQILLLLNAKGNNNDNVSMMEQKELYNIAFDNSDDISIKNNYIGKAVFANYFRGSEAVGGKIYFDDAGLTFKSHKFNFQRGETRIEYNRIRGVSKVKTLGLVPNGILIFTKDGSEHQFVVYNREKIIDFLRSITGSQG